MKKSFFGKSVILAAMMMFGIGTASAQSESFYGIGNRVGIGVGVGTEGIGIDASVSLTKYLQARVGVNIVPNININTTATASADVSINGQNSSQDYDVDITGKFSRTTVDVKLDVYPFGNSSSFFLTGGFSFGGGDLMTITGHSEELKTLAAQSKDYGIEIGDYKIPVDANGDVNGGIKVKNFRPYVGLGFGRLIPKNRVGFRFELGAQFQGKPKVYADGTDDVLKNLDQDTDDDISKFMDYLKVYPVLKLSIRTRIL